jgi:phosphoglycolate phosphatase-like HAD superfamily hydrolase
VTAEPSLVLWDIDCTLIDGGNVSRRAYAAAFRRAVGRELEVTWRFDGQTELSAASWVLRTHGIDPAGGMLERFLDLIVVELRARKEELRTEGRVLPGAAQALAALAELGVTQSVLTGNLRAIALLKLGALGLEDHLDLRIGGFGGDGYERTELPRAVFDRTERYLGHRHSGTDTVIIGDTLRDVATARAAGARAIAVATGNVSAAELAAAGADVVLADLANTESVLKAIR